MDEPSPEFAAALREVVAGPDEAQHPEPETLVAYHHDRLDARQADALQEHLARCRACADLLLELVELSRGEAAAATPGVADLAEEAAWRRLAGRLREEAGPASPGRPTAGHLAAPGARRAGRWPGVGYALAAGFLVTSVGLGIRVAILSGELGALRRPRVNIPIVNLEPAGFTRGDRSPAAVAAAHPAVVILNPPRFPVAGSYGVEVVAPDGRRLWTGAGLLPTAAGNFHLELPENLLAPGEVRIRLLQGRDEVVAEFALRVTP